jgi:tRNA G10  N-methylase Trm11
MDKQNKKVIKSVMNSDKEVLIAVKDLYLSGENFELDPCFSTGKFYEDLELPAIKYDKIPQIEGVLENDLMNGIPQPDNSIKSIVFDPPFMFEKRNRENLNIMKQRFSMFHGGFEELELMYKKSLKEFYRILKKNGIVAFKCQDFTDSQTTLTHCYVHNWAIEQGFRIEDLFIMCFKGGRVWNSNLVQRHARKYHSYWIILRK